MIKWLIIFCHFVGVVSTIVSSNYAALAWVFASFCWAVQSEAFDD